MKIAMIGSGATGSVFAAFLRLGGDELYLVDPYRAHMDAVRDRGLLLRLPDGESLVKGFHTSYSADGLGIMDAVILLTKTIHTETAMEGALGCIGPDTVVLTLQNGLGNVERLMKYVPKSRILYGSGIIGTELPEPGVCVGKPVPGAAIHFGAAEPNELASRVGTVLRDSFLRGGCDANFDEDIAFYVWRKAIGNIGGNAMIGLLRLKAGDMWDDEHACRILDKVLKECAAVAEACGLDGEAIYAASYKPKLGALRDYLSSTAQDMLIYKRQTEIDSLNGAIVEYGKQLGIPTPYNEFITEMVKAIQGNYDKQYQGNYDPV